MKNTKSCGELLTRFVLAGAMVAGLCASPMSATRAGVGTATSSGSQLPTQSQNSPAATATAQLTDLPALIAHFGQELQWGGAKRVAIISGYSPANDQNALEDWLVDQVKNALTQGPNALVLIPDPRGAGRNSGKPNWAIAGVDDVVSVSLYPGVGGIQVTLNGAPNRPDQMENGPRALVSQTVPLTDEMAALLPPEWKKQIEEERASEEVPFDTAAAVARKPKCTSCKDPKFPEVSTQLRVAGSVRIIATVEADGTVRDIQLYQGFGFGADEVAVDAVGNWKYKPALDKSGNPIASKVQIEVHFRPA